ncbi:MAG: glycosyltransferase family 2 protein [Calothrix sp. SM1_7_51]|nr:glycosyltransferase family 2 protein [Calothrix sp. SM1_7_51]
MTLTNKQSVLSQSSYQYIFTVFTPTYNRASTLCRVYDSLQAQTYRNFEWLIVDDGSTDYTRDLVKQWERGGQFSINYIWQKNQGKHIAFNRGVKEAKGELFLTIDSDDGCVPEALERFQYHWYSIPEEERDNFSAVTALCINQSGKLVGNEFPLNIIDSNSIEIRTKHRVSGEKWGFQKTDVLKICPFPEFPGEKFITEDIVWNRISLLNLKTRFINERLRIYYEDTTVSLSNSSIQCRARNPKGTIAFYKEYSQLNIPIYWKVRGLVNYIRFSFHASYKPIDIINYSENIFLCTILLLSGFICYLIDRYSLAKQE